MSITVERAMAADAEALVGLQIRAFHHDAQLYPGVEVGGPPGYDSVEALIKDVQQYDTFKIMYDGQIVGGVIVFAMGEGHYHLDRIYIDPDHHNRGIGTQAMQYIEQTYRATRWTLDTPKYATRNQHFYEKLGYVKVREHEVDGIVLIAYEKRLSTQE